MVWERWEVSDEITRLDEAWARISVPACTCTLCNDLEPRIREWLDDRLVHIRDNPQRGGRTARGVPSLLAACEDAGVRLVTKSRLDDHMKKCIRRACPVVGNG